MHLLTAVLGGRKVILSLLTGGRRELCRDRELAPAEAAANTCIKLEIKKIKTIYQILVLLLEIT